MTDFRAKTRDTLHRLLRADAVDLPQLAQSALGSESVWDIAHPVNQLCGADDVAAGFFAPLRNAMPNAYRRDELFVGGQNIREHGGQWVASLTHYVGRFEHDLFGVKASGRMVFLRSGEFYRIENGMIIEAKIIIDLLDLMRQAGRFPLPQILGTEMLFPGPATHDGVLPNGNNGAASLDIVQGMLGDLHVYDPETNGSSGQTGTDGYWHDDMIWYGPGGVGSTHRWDGFVDHHRAAFLEAFPDRQGGNHYCRIGDGDYAAVSGWPSMTMTHKGDYLGIPATNKALTLRVMDFYRLTAGQIIENWVCLDYVDLLLQMGVDVIERSAALDSQLR